MCPVIWEGPLNQAPGSACRLPQAWLSGTDELCPPRPPLPTSWLERASCAKWLTSGWLDSLKTTNTQPGKVGRVPDAMWLLESHPSRACFFLCQVGPEWCPQRGNDVLSSLDRSCSYRCHPHQVDGLGSCPLWPVHHQIRCVVLWDPADGAHHDKGTGCPTLVRELPPPIFSPSAPAPVTPLLRRSWARKPSWA